MDTRTKIVGREELEERLDSRPARWITGHFDPLLAEHVRWLAEERFAGGALVVEVTDPPQPLLAQRARAELVAALGMVDFVILGGCKSAEDAGVSERFIAHVLRRHQQEPLR